MEETLIPETGKEKQGVDALLTSQDEAPASLKSGELPVSPEKDSEQSVGEKLDALLHQVVTPTTHTASISVDVQTDAQNIDMLLDEESKVRQLVDMAVVKGVVHAVAVARKMNDYYVLDKMHDELVDKLYDNLLTQGLIHKD
ncbi:MAG: hypothetical protein ACSLEX_03940 [Minisyncoccota bacterium]